MELENVVAVGNATVVVLELLEKIPPVAPVAEMRDNAFATLVQVTNCDKEEN